MTDTNDQTTPATSKILLIFVASLSVVIGVWVSQSILKKQAEIPQNLQATLLDIAKPLSPFELIDHNNSTFNLQSLKGNWSFLFFGFTNCPDVCPLSLQVMRSVWKSTQLKSAKLTNLKMIFISVDPARDTPEILKSYVQYYNPEFIGVTGKASEIDKLTKRIGILYGIDEPNENGDYNVSHSGQIILIDPQGSMRGVFSPPLLPQSIANDFIAIKKYVDNNK